jgi:type IV pilus biogenesis protein CpaD/CtpE
VAPLRTQLAVHVRLYDAVAKDGHVVVVGSGSAEESTAAVDGRQVAHVARAFG